MDQILGAFLEAIEVGPMQHHKNMTVYCLLTANETSTDFLTLDEALSRNVLAVSEVSEAGSVPQLKVENKSEQKVILLDGEELSGAKQNRVLNVTVLIAADSMTIIPVSCVEQGRWSYRSKKFHSESRVMSPRMKQKKTESVSMRLKTDQSYEADQSLVWDEVRDKHARMETLESPTMAMADLYEFHQQSCQGYASAFHVVENQVGIIVLIDGIITGAELLPKFDSFRVIHAKLINSYVMDALETANHETPTEDAGVLRGKALTFLGSARDAIVERRQSVALGFDLRLESQDIIGSGLEFDNQILQMSVFLKDEGGASRQQTGGFQRASRRKTALQSR